MQHQTRSVPLLLLLSLWLGSSCQHRVMVSTNPVGAEVLCEERSLGVSPVELQLTREEAASLTLKLPGYRSLTLDIRGSLHPLRRLVSGQPDHVRVLLVREHGPSGTWGPEDVAP